MLAIDPARVRLDCAAPAWAALAADTGAATLSTRAASRSGATAPPHGHPGLGRAILREMAVELTSGLRRLYPDLV